MTALLFAVVGAIIIAAIVWLNWATRDNWEPHRLSRRVTLVDGSIAERGLIMRKKVRGEWHYRRPTKDESDADELWHAIR